MRNVVIIGSSGFLGSAVTKELITNGFQVYATKNKRTVPREPGLTVIEGGIKSLTTRTLDRISPVAIFHCARPVVPRLRRWGRIFAARKAMRYNRFLLSQIAATRYRPVLIFASGSLVYGNSDAPRTEDAPLNPISYSRQYHHGEDPVLRAAGEKKTKVLLLRFPWLMGNGSWFSWFYLKPLRKQKLVPLFGDGNNKMSLISVTDAAMLMVKYYLADLPGGVYNVFSPNVFTQKVFAEAVAGHFGGSVTAYRDIFPRGVEKAVSEAFTSNILFQSRHSELLENHVFQTLEQMLDEIRTI